MTHRIVLRPEAQDELTNAFEYLEQQRTGLGAQFAVQVQKVLDRIAVMPQIHGVVLGDTRRVLVNKFHYSVFYRMQGNEVVVTAVVHQRQESFHLAKTGVVWPKIFGRTDP